MLTAAVRTGTRSQPAASTRTENVFGVCAPAIQTVTRVRPSLAAVRTTPPLSLRATAAIDGSSTAYRATFSAGNVVDQPGNNATSEGLAGGVGTASAARAREDSDRDTTSTALRIRDMNGLLPGRHGPPSDFARCI